jgi:hypothetical protein
LYLLCKYEFLYDDEKGWYQLKDNRWNSCSKECRVLRNSISVIKEMMLTEYKNMYQNVISPLQNIIRDLEDKEEMDTDDRKTIEEHYKKITELEENRQFLLTICDKLDELVYKNKIIKECTDLFYDTDGIIKRYVTTEIVNDKVDIKSQEIDIKSQEIDIKSQEIDIKSQEIDIKSTEVNNTSIEKQIIESPIELFIKYLVMEDTEYKKDVILLSSVELESKCDEFRKKYNIDRKICHISIIKFFNSKNINGITTGVRVTKKDIIKNKIIDSNKTEFNKPEIKKYLGM